jgi:hypothetical protein
VTTATINQHLAEIYQGYLDHLYQQTWKEGTSAPLLMHAFSEYIAMSRKILFVGQETHTWGGLINAEPALSALLQTYQGFEFGKHYLKNGKPPRILTSSFRNFIRSSFSGLNGDVSGANRHTNGFLWTNISKFDTVGTTPAYEVQRQNAAGFFLLKDEIAIARPDIVVFLTGHKYDCWINKIFQPTCQELLPNGLLYSLTTVDHSLPHLTFKTEHPRTLCQRKLYKTILHELVKVASH